MSLSVNLTAKKVLAFGLAGILMCSVSPASYAASPQVVSGGAPALTFEQSIEAVVVHAFDGLAEQLAPQVVAAITPEVEAISAQIQASILETTELKDSIETTGFVMDMSQIPPEEVVARIPDIALAEVREQVQTEVRESIAADFAKSEAIITEQVKALLQSALPALVIELEPALKALIPKVHSMIETNIEARIETDILQAIPDLMTLIPDEMAGLSPEEIAAQMKASMKAKVEAVVRPEFEAKIKAQIDALMIEKIKAPIQEKFQPRLSALDASAYDVYVDQLPDYLERVISKTYIKSLVSENIAAMKTRLPGIVEAVRADVDYGIDEFIRATIEEEAKIYIEGSYLKAPIQPVNVNGRLLVPFRAIAEVLGAQVEWRYQERQVVMTKGETEIVLTIDSNVVLVNGVEKTLDVDARIVESSTVVPVRFIAETFQMDVDWQHEWKLVSIEATG